mmetsp:Transcript_35709/g.77989  ORF Transcript_35709/g.77989 Transcript_35709/m.77989 type:complete len:210 (+) Transcript_35709:22-651(+)
MPLHLFSSQLLDHATPLHTSLLPAGHHPSQNDFEGAYGGPLASNSLHHMNLHGSSFVEAPHESRRPLEDKDAQDLRDLASFRTEHRRTEDGRLCAGAFVHNGQTYTGCTEEENPDGVAGREWCFVEPSLVKHHIASEPKEPGAGTQVSSSWGYCAPRPDYNEMRQAAYDAAKHKELQAEQMLGDLAMARRAAEHTLDDAKDLAQATAAA